MEYFKLKDCTQIPAIAFGPGMMTRNFIFRDNSNIMNKIFNKYSLYSLKKQYYKVIYTAICKGFRFIDHSIAYGNEDLIANAIYKSGIPRQNFFLSTRISNKSQFEKRQKISYYRSLEKMKLDYFDLLMFHWPIADNYLYTWEMMEELHQEGVVKYLGVSNCNQHHLDRLIHTGGILPIINQIEIHPLFTQKKLINYCLSKNILVQAYTPLARMDERLFRLPKLRKIAIKYDKTLAQIVLRWHIQNNILPVVRSFNPNRIQDNLSIFDFKLSYEEMNIINSFNINSRLRYDPDNCDFSIL